MLHIASIVILILLAGNAFSAELKTGLPSGGAKGQESDKCRIELDDHLRGCRKYLQQGLSDTSKEANPDQTLVMMYRNCSHPLLQDRLTPGEREKIRSLSKPAQEAEQKLTKKDLDDIKIVIAYFYSPCARTYTMQDKDELLVKFNQIWQSMADAFEANDIEKVVSFWNPSDQDPIRKHFLQYSVEKCKRTASDMRKDRIVIDSIEDGAMIICRNDSTRDGKHYSPTLIFVPGLDGQWLLSLDHRVSVRAAD